MSTRRSPERCTAWCSRTATPSRASAPLAPFSDASTRPACLVLDVHLNGTGFELQERLTADGMKIPIIFTTADDSDPTRRRIETSGAAGRLPVEARWTPGKGGDWLIGQVRALPQDRGGVTPAACLTGRAGPGDRAHVLGAGFQYHIAKPVDMRRLLGIVGVLASHSTGGADQLTIATTPATLTRRRSASRRP